MRRPPIGRDLVVRLGSALLLTVLGFGSAAAAADRSNEGEIAASAGELRYHARAIAFRHGPNEARAEFVLRVPYAEMKFLPQDSLYSARLRVTAEMWNPSGKRVGFQQREAQVMVADPAVGLDSLLGEIYTLGVAVPQGKYKYRVVVEDMNVARQGLIYKMKNQKRQGKVEGEIDMGRWLFQSPALSGLELAWTIAPRGESTAFGKGPYEVYPQPSGYFGLFKDEISVYYEIYDRPVPAEGRAYRLQTSVLAADGDTVFATVDSLRMQEGSAWPHALSIDASAIPAGHYRLRLTLSRAGESAIATSQTEFDVLWSAQSWRPGAADFYEVEATTLLSAEQAVDFRMLSMGEKEVRMEKAWRETDPSPETAENESHVEFLRRVEVANARFSIFGPGMLSDRGRVYIRYGEPDETKVERLPVADKTLGYALGDQIPKASRDALTKIDQGAPDYRPYEIWTYNLRGKELGAHYGMSEINSGMKFVFVDDHGYGEYTLRYSSTSGMH